MFRSTLWYSVEVFGTLPNSAAVFNTLAYFGIIQQLFVLCSSLRDLQKTNRIGGVMVRRARLECGRSWVPAPVGSIQTVKLICCFSAKHAALRRKSKNWLARNLNNVSE